MGTFVKSVKGMNQVAQKLCVLPLHGPWPWRTVEDICCHPICDSSSHQHHPGRCEKTDFCPQRSQTLHTMVVTQHSYNSPPFCGIINHTWWPNQVALAPKQLWSSFTALSNCISGPWRIPRIFSCRSLSHQHHPNINNIIGRDRGTNIHIIPWWLRKVPNAKRWWSSISLRIFPLHFLYEKK